MKSDAFLELYRDYESLLREQSNIDPKEEEAHADDLTGNRLRMCRMFRNYLVHTPDPGFIEVSDKMEKFLTSYVNSLRFSGDVAKKHMKRADACVVPIKGHVSDALAVFNKLRQPCVVIDLGDGNYGLLSVFDIICTPSRSKLDVLKIKKLKPAFCGPLDDFSSLDSDKVTLCTEDGTPDGKLLGQIIF